METGESIAAMIPAGYLAKFIIERPDWLTAAGISGIHSVSDCISHDFDRRDRPWQRNALGFFDSPAIIRGVATEGGLDLTGARWFYYEVHNREFDEKVNQWDPIPSAAPDVERVRPGSGVLEGFDVVTFSTGTFPECSPLSCNSLAEHVPTNELCLLGSFEEARVALEQGRFTNAEPGPLRIVAVYAIEWPVHQ